ncbi:hypothetical protein [Burkholderia pseudomultivorans]|uniref:hypothetical protein n=1 Tax=Burkholderia pseudomultivorans TaxID=1207504 RepID=UPI0002EF051E|nr:hypothetical protein [Burkholderia pseudomultivorans]
MSQRFPAVSSGAVPRRIRAHADIVASATIISRISHRFILTTLPLRIVTGECSRRRAAVGAFHGKTSVGGAMRDS